MDDATVHSRKRFLINIAPGHDRAARDVSSAERLRQSDDVRLELPMLETKHFSSATQSGLDFIGNKQCAVFAAKLLGVDKKIRFGCLAVFALHRFDHERGDLARTQLSI